MGFFLFSLVLLWMFIMSIWGRGGLEEFIDGLVYF